MPYHIIVKKNEFEVAPKLQSIFNDFQCLLVHEVGNEGDHWHFWSDCSWKEDKVRREIDKIRLNKLKGVSVRPWDDNLVYFCKGGNYNDYPDILFNSVKDLSDDRVIELHNQWWDTHNGIEGKDPDFKMPKVLNLLVDGVRDTDMDEDDVINLMIDIIEQCGGKKMASIKSTGQAYVRTALLFTNQKALHRKNLFNFYKKGLWN